MKGQIMAVDLEAVASLSIRDIALDAILYSCSLDFATSLDWAQWCRLVAKAAREGDLERLRELIEIESKQAERAERAKAWLAILH